MKSCVDALTEERLNRAKRPIERTKTGFPELVHMAVGQNQWYHFGIAAPPISEPIFVRIGMFTGGTGGLTHGQMTKTGCRDLVHMAPKGDRLGPILGQVLQIYTG